MRKALRLGLLVTVACLVWYQFSRQANPHDEDIDKAIGIDDTLPYNPHRIDSGRVDTSAYRERDTTPYKGNYIDVN